MSVSYKKLWKLLIDKDMKKKDLCEKAGISPASVTKMGRNGHVTTEILVKICAALDCRIACFREGCGRQQPDGIIVVQCPDTDTGQFADFVNGHHGYPSSV